MRAVPGVLGAAALWLPVGRGRPVLNSWPLRDKTGLMAAMEPRQGWPVVGTEHAADTTVTIVRSGTRQIHRRVGVSSGGRVEGGGVQHLLGKRDSYLSDAAMQRRGPGVWGFVAGMG